MVRRSALARGMNQALIVCKVCIAFCIGAALLLRTAYCADAAQPLAQYMVLGEGGQAIVRAIVRGDACPALVVDGVAQPMDTRAAPGTAVQRPNQIIATEFPVRVCETLLPKAAHSARIAGRSLPPANFELRRVVVIGDTGCRMKASASAYQNCMDPAAWPLHALAAAAAKEHSDLVRTWSCMSGITGSETMRATKIPHSHRRDALFAFLGTVAAAWWPGPSNGKSATTGQGGAAARCVATPAQTEGPYFIDEHLNRSDIRPDPLDGSVRPGLPLNLQIQVSGIGPSGCRPLAGAIVGIWHCDAQGAYSDVSERHFKTVGSRFLRGYQVTDATGSVRFVTIYPGWYPRRAVHIHFKVRTTQNAARALQWTSQLYFDDRMTDQAHRHAAYPQRNMPRTRNAEDDIFQDGGPKLLLKLSEAEDGYSARFDAALPLAS